MSLTHQVQMKMMGKRDPQQEKEALEWIFSILGEAVPQGRFEDILQDGTILCRLINKMSPGAVPKINTSGGQFKMMENINNFLKAIKQYGVPIQDLFQTADLYEKKQLSSVSTTLFALGRASYMHPEWPGPWLGPRPSEENKREFSEEQLAASKTVIGLQAGSNKGATQAGDNTGAQRRVIVGK